MKARRTPIYRLMRWHDSRGVAQDLWRIEQLEATSTKVWLTIEAQIYDDKNRAIDRLEELMRPPETWRARVWRLLRERWTGPSKPELWETL